MEQTIYDQMLAKAKRGDVECKYKVGKAIYDGKAVFTDYQMGKRFGYAPDYGVELIQEAAEAGHADAMALFGTITLVGEYVRKDISKGIDLIWKGAQNGSALGQNNLGWFYYVGEYLEKNLENAFYWTYHGAQNGFDESMETLGVMYWNGDGTERHYDGAIYWLKKAVEAGKGNLTGLIKLLESAGLDVPVGKLSLVNGKWVWSEASKYSKQPTLREVFKKITGYSFPISGGYGTSFDDAIVIEEDNERDGVRLERVILSILFKNPTLKEQKLVSLDGMHYDIMTVESENGVQAVYFIVDNFLGKTGAPF